MIAVQVGARLERRQLCVAAYGPGSAAGRSDYDVWTTTGSQRGGVPSNRRARCRHGTCGSTESPRGWQRPAGRSHGCRAIAIATQTGPDGGRHGLRATSAERGRAYEEPRRSELRCGGLAVPWDMPLTHLLHFRQCRIWHDAMAGWNTIFSIVVVRAPLSGSGRPRGRRQATANRQQATTSATDHPPGRARIACCFFGTDQRRPEQPLFGRWLHAAEPEPRCARDTRILTSNGQVAAIVTCSDTTS